jgi:hypothetical protein
VFQDGSDGWPTLTPPTPIRLMSLVISNQPTSPTPASRYRLIDRLYVTPTSFYADVYIFGARYILRSSDSGKETGNETLAGLDLNPIASLAFRIGRGAYLREMRRADATNILRPYLRYGTDVRSHTIRLIPDGSRWLRPFYSKRFHALLNSLFKVLFNFPSRYLFAIGLVVIFSLRRGLPSA